MKKMLLLLALAASGYSFAQNLQTVTDNDNTTTNGIRVTGSNKLVGGAALEIYYHDGIGNVVSHDRQSHLFRPLYIQSLATSFVNGPVGIGTTAPEYNLDVDGNAMFRAGANARAESHFYLGTYADPHAGVGYALKIGSGGLAVNGNAVFLDGNVGIGTLSPQSKLAVNGVITSTKIKVTQNGWADYVFDSSYKLPSLPQIETFIKENKHLPEVPSAAEVKKEGLDLGDNQAILLKKIEELTLYIIQQNKKMEQMEKRLAEVESKQSN